MLPTLTALQAALDKGETTSVALTQAALARIADPGGEGARGAELSGSGAAPRLPVHSEP